MAISLLLVAGPTWAWAQAQTKPAAAEPATDLYPPQLARVLAEKCGDCHSPQTREGELDLTSWQSLKAGGESGQVLDPAAPLLSLVWERIAAGDMPPDDAEPLEASERQLIERWLTEGEWRNSFAAEPLHQHDVLPILLLRCARCHGRQQQQGELDIRSVAALLKGGKSGPAIVPGHAEESLLLRRIHAEEMPPREDLARYSVKPMESHEVEIVTRWIAEGAREVDIQPDVATDAPDPLVTELDRDFWAFQSPQLPNVPAAQPVSSAASVAANPIDAFIRAELAARGLATAPSADAQTLIRRATFDLHGLPPTPSEVAEFQQAFQARGPAAFHELVDRLLASPRYAERWANHWLDVAGYADSEGVQHSDPIREHVWRYRDYVIRAFDSDKPYDRFLLEQIAGDELADYENNVEVTDEIYDNLVATAFLKLSPDGTFAGITGFVPDRLEVIDDTLEVLSSSVMGLTIRCARCHSHKFDPIPQRDYYRLAAVFKGALDEHGWLRPIHQSDLPGIGVRRLPYVTSVERRQWEASEAAIDRDLEALTAAGGSEEEVKALQARRQPEPMVRALWDSGDPSPTYVLRRGNYLLPDRLVGPGVPSVLTDGQTPFVVEPPWPGSNKTGRRLAFARWLVSPDHPLTARVLVNRLWRHHFGVGIVRTLDDFGKAGSGASHPELLDWLANEFIRSGWSLKQMHRLMLTSATWQQSSLVSESMLAWDPDNVWLSRMPLRKLDAEALQDTLISAAGQLNEQRFGPAEGVESRGDGLVDSSGRNGTWRRSVYVIKRRTEPVTLLATFDRPGMNPNCIDRPESTVAPQALHLMNNRTVQELAGALAARVQRQVPADSTEQVFLAWQLATGRQPNAAELRLAAAELHSLRDLWADSLRSAEPQRAEELIQSEAQTKALANLCHAIFNSAAFLYID